ncbi:MAG: flap endonuclease-1 [Candidatus Altiarchaeota archaeon]|nr:flap endonuclease-1 [Candidatus Altiarchaeota archaeon]
MGVNLKDIVSHEPISFEDLKGRVIAVDALNMLYQFLASIRQPDGTPLMDSKGRVTSHLSGLFYRTVRLVHMGIKPVYVFDGEPPKLKEREIERRRGIKKEAMYEWERAKRDGRLEDARKYAMRTSRVTEEMLDDSKNLLSCMGIPYVQAPSEGEAQCVHLCIKGDAWAVGSQDYDSLLLGAPKLVRGLTLSGTFELTLMELERILEGLSLNRSQLIDIAILVGTDFNEGVKGIGPKKALRIVREGRLDEIKAELDFDYNAVKEIFLNPKVTDEYVIEWSAPNRTQTLELLSGEYGFSEDRVNKAVSNLEKSMKEFTQKDLSAWF